MKRLQLLTAALLLAVAMTMTAQVRVVENLNFGWRFHEGNVENGASAQLNDSQWRTVDLPHDFQIEQPWVAPEKNEKILILFIFLQLSLCSFKATPHKDRLAAQHQICLIFFRHSTQNSLEIRQYYCGRFMHSAEKIYCASLALPLCGIALNKKSE